LHERKLKLAIRVNCIGTQDELEEAKSKVAWYQDKERQEGQVNRQFSSGMMGHVKQAWKLGHWNTADPESALGRLITYQRRNFPLFGQRPIGQLAIRVRDYVSLQSKNPSISASNLERLFKDLWKRFREDMVTFLEAEGFLKDSGHLRTCLDDEALREALHRHRSQVPPSTVQYISDRFIGIRDGMRTWQVLITLPNVKIENAEQLPNIDDVSFLNPHEAQSWYDVMKEDGWLNMDFGSVEGKALVGSIEARDATRAAQIAHRRVCTVLDRFLFCYQFGHYSNPKPSIGEAVCIETTTTGERKLWFAASASNEPDRELLLRHPDNFGEQIEVLEKLDKLLVHEKIGHRLARRSTRAIYWYRKGLWSQLTEDRLLNYWVSLETLVGPDEEEKDSIFYRHVIPYRTGLLAPVQVPVDERITYRQLRDWTREFVDDVYSLRNEIIHGGVFEGPSFERFVDRFRSIVHYSIFTVLFAFTSELPTPDELEELLAWILDRNPDEQVAVPCGLICPNSGLGNRPGA